MRLLDASNGLGGSDMNDIHKFEYSMGNGQCPCCEGVTPEKGKFNYYRADQKGHNPRCALARVMEASGYVVVYANEKWL
jgi:hypothetical protein